LGGCASCSYINAYLRPLTPRSHHASLRCRKRFVSTLSEYLLKNLNRADVTIQLHRSHHYFSRNKRNAYEYSSFALQMRNRKYVLLFNAKLHISDIKSLLILIKIWNYTIGIIKEILKRFRLILFIWVNLSTDIYCRIYVWLYNEI